MPPLSESQVCGCESHATAEYDQKGFPRDPVAFESGSGLATCREGVRRCPIAVEFRSTMRFLVADDPWVGSRITVASAQVDHRVERPAVAAQSVPSPR